MNSVSDAGVQLLLNGKVMSTRIFDSPFLFAELRPISIIFPSSLLFSDFNVADLPISFPPWLRSTKLVSLIMGTYYIIIRGREDRGEHLWLALPRFFNIFLLRHANNESEVNGSQLGHCRLEILVDTEIERGDVTEIYRNVLY